MTKDKLKDNILRTICCLNSDISNKDRNLLRKEYSLKEDLENESEENLIKAIYKMNAGIMKNR